MKGMSLTKKRSVLLIYRSIFLYNYMLTHLMRDAIGGVHENLEKRDGRSLNDFRIGFAENLSSVLKQLARRWFLLGARRMRTAGEQRHHFWPWETLRGNETETVRRWRPFGHLVSVIFPGAIKYLNAVCSVQPSVAVGNRAKHIKTSSIDMRMLADSLTNALTHAAERLTNFKKWSLQQFSAHLIIKPLTPSVICDVLTFRLTCRSIFLRTDSASASMTWKLRFFVKLEKVLNAPVNRGNSAPGHAKWRARILEAVLGGDASASRYVLKRVLDSVARSVCINFFWLGVCLSLIAWFLQLVFSSQVCYCFTTNAITLPRHKYLDKRNKDYENAQKCYHFPEKLPL